MLRAAYAEVLRGEPKNAKINLPILVTARQVLEAEPLDSLLSIAGPKVTAELKGRTCVQILMVDALDEVPSSRRQEALDRAVQLAEELKASLLITSRKVDLVKSAPKGFTEYELLPFEVHQALKLFEKLLHGRKDMLDALKVGLEKIRFNIPMVPLSLIFLLDLVEERKLG